MHRKRLFSHPNLIFSTMTLSWWPNEWQILVWLSMSKQFKMQCITSIIFQLNFGVSQQWLPQEGFQLLRILRRSKIMKMNYSLSGKSLESGRSLPWWSIYRLLNYSLSTHLKTNKSGPSCYKIFQPLEIHFITSQPDIIDYTKETHYLALG